MTLNILKYRNASVMFRKTIICISNEIIPIACTKEVGKYSQTRLKRIRLELPHWFHKSVESNVVIIRNDNSVGTMILPI